MTVEPGFGGQKFMKDVAREKLLAARDLLRHKSFGGEVHVDGGINRETAEFAGALGVDIFVVGSALFLKGHDMGREIRLIRALADEGYQFTLNGGVPPIPRDKMVRSRRCRSTSPTGSWPTSRPAASPSSCSAAKAALNPDGTVTTTSSCPPASRPSSSSATQPRASCTSRRPNLARGVHPRARGDPAAQLPVRALLQRTTGARVRVGGEVVGEIGNGLVVFVGVGPDDTEAVAADLARKAAELRIFRDEAGRTNVSLLDSAVRRSSCRSSRCTPTRAAVAGPGSGAASPALAERLYEQFVAALRALGIVVATGRFGTEMAVELVNDGPFTIWLDTAER